MKPLHGETAVLSRYIPAYGGDFSDLTIGARFTWGDDLNAEYEIINDTLVLRETYDGARYFYFPLGKDTDAAFAFMEKQAIADGEPLRFCALDEKQVGIVKKRYPYFEYDFLRDWSDYIYPADNFAFYAGKKMAGQRNHVNKFNKTYPYAKTHILTESDLPKIRVFMDEYEHENNLTGFAAEEQRCVKELIDNFTALNQFGMYITVGEKVISFSLGEKVKDTLFVHIEKGLKGYAGVYPKTAQEFAKTFVTPEIRFINREEDCGDEGLRISKTQYHPTEIKSKFFGEVHTAFDAIIAPVNITTERLTVCEIDKTDKENYFRLYTDDDNNKFWGYDYREDLGDSEPSPDYFYGFMQSLKDKKEEYSLAVKKDGALIGEIVLWNFKLNGEVETGFRFFKEYQGKGYATESLNAVVYYAFSRLGAPAVNSRCKKLNTPSFNLLTRCGYKQTTADDEYFYFKKESR